MSERFAVFGMVTFLHDLFTAVWIGGLIMMGITLIPAVRKTLGRGPQVKELMDAIQRRQSILVYISIAGLILTGFLQARRSPAFVGLFSFANTYSMALAVKHILVAAMVAISLYRSLAVGRRGQPLTPSQEKLSAGLLFLNIGMGITVLLLSGLLAALPVLPG